MQRWFEAGDVRGSLWVSLVVTLGVPRCHRRVLPAPRSGRGPSPFPASFPASRHRFKHHCFAAGCDTPARSLWLFHQLPETMGSVGHSQFITSLELSGRLVGKKTIPASHMAGRSVMGFPNIPPCRNPRSAGALPARGWLSQISDRVGRSRNWARDQRARPRRRVGQRLTGGGECPSRSGRAVLVG